MEKSTLGNVLLALVLTLTVNTFSNAATLSPREAGTTNLALTGYPFGIGAGLSLAGAHVPVTLQGATVAVVPIPPALWLFASGLLGLFGIRQRRGARNHVGR